MDCTNCRFCETRTQVVFPTPCEQGGLLAIGEAPGADEDIAGEGFIGKSGQRLDALLATHGIARHQYGRANICWCRPPGNQTPLKKDISSCLPRLAKSILDIRPKVLLLIGRVPTEVFMGAGLLQGHIEASKLNMPFADACAPHPALANVLADKSIHIIPMPHTSGLAWNRPLKDGTGRRFSDLGTEQIARAVSLLAKG